MLCLNMLERVCVCVCVCVCVLHFLSLFYIQVAQPIWCYTHTYNSCVLLLQSSLNWPTTSEHVSKYCVRVCMCVCMWECTLHNGYASHACVGSARTRVTLVIFLVLSGPHLAHDP